MIEEARQFDRDLHQARWQLTRSTYVHYAEESSRLLGADQPAADRTRSIALSMAAAVESLWEEWREQSRPAERFDGQRTDASSESAIFLAWRGRTERAVAFVAGPEFVSDRILGPLGPQLLDKLRARVELSDGKGGTVASYGNPRDEPGDLPPVRLPPDETKLPWHIRVVGPQSDLADSVYRQRVLIAALVCLALIVVAGSYFSARAMAREMEAARLQSEFVAAVSHEFRTPLTLLRQFSDMLADGRVSNDEERGMYYAALQRGTRRLTRLVEDLLDFARMEAGSRAFHLEPMRAREWLTRLIGEFNQETKSKGYQAELAWTGPSAVVRADEAAIGRAVWNLLDNAVKYSPACRTIWVDGAFEKGTLTISVRDRGLGVPAAERRAIFRKFVRGSSTNGHVAKGTGLGLALVKQIAEAHRGTVHLESAVGEGSTFSIRLPADADDREQGEWLTS
jgi:signal transduction histidine kinase